MVFSTGRRTILAIVAGLLTAGPAAAQEQPEAPRVSVAVPPPDVAAPPEDALRTASGLASKVLAPGTGSAHPGTRDLATVHYTGWTTEGRLFDSSVLRGQPAVVRVNEVMPGWTEALQLMVVGERRRLWVPEELAYQGAAGRPAGMLVFDVELLDLLQMPTTPPDVAGPPADAERTRSGLAYRVLTPGTGSRHPGRTSTVVVHYTGWTTDGEMFDSSVERGAPISMRLDQFIDGWAEGVQLMVEGEKRRLWLPEALAYRGRQGAPRGMLVFDVELIAIDP